VITARARAAESAGRLAALYGAFVLLVLLFEAFGPERLTRVIGRRRGDLLVTTRDFQLE
jgi:hypothetical protein